MRRIFTESLGKLAEQFALFCVQRFWNVDRDANELITLAAGLHVQALPADRSPDLKVGPAGLAADRSRDLKVGTTSLAANRSPGLAAGLANQVENPGAALSAYRPVLDRYCVTCHNQRLKTGGVMLDTADLTKIRGNGELWERVLRKLRSASMPPLGLPRPVKK